MSKSKFVLNRSGVRELLKSQEMLTILEQKGNAALNTLGNGYELISRTGKTRSNVKISASTFKARKENSNNNSILKAVLAQRG